MSNIQELNRQLAEKINSEARRDPQSQYANKFVGIANGIACFRFLNQFTYGNFGDPSLFGLEK